MLDTACWWTTTVFSSCLVCCSLMMKKCILVQRNWGKMEVCGEKKEVFKT